MICFNQPAVSVIIPCYNSAEHLNECLDSLIAQDYKDWEALVIIAPSTDNTVEIAESYARKDQRFLVHKEPRKSTCARARNTGFHNSFGKYIALLDSDDYWMPEKLSIMVCVMESRPDLKWCAHQFKDPVKFPMQSPYESAVNNTIFRKEYLQEIENKWGYVFKSDLPRADDADLAMRIRNDPSFMIGWPLSYYRKNPKGLTQSVSYLEMNQILLPMAIRYRCFDFLPAILKEIVKWKIISLIRR